MQDERRRDSRGMRPMTPGASYPQDLQLLVEGDGHPVGLRLRPLELVDLRLGVVGQDGVCRRGGRGVSRVERRGHGVAGQQRCVVGRRGAARGGVGRWEARSGRRAAGFGAPSIGLGMCDRSQMSAWLSSPAVLMWHDECGAHASEFTHCEERGEGSGGLGRGAARGAGARGRGIGGGGTSGGSGS